MATRPAQRDYRLSPTAPFPGLPELDYVGWSTTRRAEPLGLHQHPVLEICHVERGSAQLWVDGETCDFTGGSLVIIRPREQHGGIRDIEQPCRYQFIGVRLDPPCLALPRRELAALKAEIARISPRSFPAPPTIGEAFATIVAALDAPRTPLATTEVRGALLRILTTVARAGRSAQTPKASVLVAEAIRIMEANLETPLALPEIARRLGWSISHLKTRFRRETGISPAESYLRRRIARACAELAQGRREVTAVALDLGFSSSQYFATAFKRIIGMTPIAYRRRHSAGMAGEPAGRRSERPRPP